MTNDEVIARKTLYLFKKFAREHHFWEEYKKLSVQLKGSRKFIDVVREYEPVELIQSSKAFCTWPSYTNNEKRTESWMSLSRRWALICFQNKLFYNEEKALKYTNYNISWSIAESYKNGEIDKLKIK